MTAKGQLLVEEDLLFELEESDFDNQIKKKYGNDCIYYLDGYKYGNFWSVDVMPNIGDVDICIDIDDNKYVIGTLSFFIKFYVDCSYGERFVNGNIFVDKINLFDKPKKSGN